MNVEPILISADPPERNRIFREKMHLPWPLLSDEDHAVADRYGVPVSRKHPKARSYRDGFLQPAVFVYRGDEEVFTFVAVPRFTNLWGAARRPSPRQVLEAVRPRLAPA
ncbi:MAG: hypothetical protein D6731_20490 [Planctomycetota bacterium]|nr:MAG: hypothetical protein D6731_20490 [Planctomycetota bacterium]